MYVNFGINNLNKDNYFGLNILFIVQQIYTKKNLYANKLVKNKILT